MKVEEQIMLEALQNANPQLVEAMSAVKGESEAGLGLYVNMLVAAGYSATLVLQKPDFYCPTGTHHTDIAIKLIYTGDSGTAPQMNGQPVDELKLCPEHIAPVMSNIPTWPKNRFTEVVIFDPKNQVKEGV